MFAASDLRCNRKSGAVCCKGQQALSWVWRLGFGALIGLGLGSERGGHPGEAVWEPGSQGVLAGQYCSSHGKASRFQQAHVFWAPPVLGLEGTINQC